MFALISDDVRRDPYPVYAGMRAASPLVHDPGTKLRLVFDYETVKWVLSDYETFSSHYGPDWLTFQDPPRHTKLRGLISRGFTPRSIATLEGRIRELSLELLTPHLGKGEFDLAADYAMPLPMLVIAEMLGIPPSDRGRFVRWVDVLLRMSYTIPGGSPESTAAMADFKEITVEMGGYLAELLADRRENPKDDLLTRLGAAEVDGQRLTPMEILGFFQLLLLAGSETTTNLISNAMLLFLEHPDQLRRLRADMSLLPSAIEEVLRYRSPLQWIYRITTREIELHGQVVPARSLVLPIIGSANRDPAVFANPETFDISRTPNPHLAFGVGQHYCMGAPLARLEAQIALTHLLGYFREFSRATTGPWAPRPGLHVLGPSSLPVRFTVSGV